MITKAIINPQPIWPIRFIKGVGMGIKGILGPLLTKTFWTKILVSCAEEMVSAFMLALGYKFMTQGREKGNPEIKKAAQHGTGGSNAFSGGFTQRPEFSSGYSQYSSSNPAFARSSQPFPGL